MDRVGEILFLTNEALSLRVECEVVEVNDENQAIKIRAVEPDANLAKMGFFEEDGQYVAFNLDIVFESQN